MSEPTSVPDVSRVLVAGASGYIGTELVSQLEAAGFEVLRLVRREPEGADEFRWDPSAGTIDDRAIERADAVINLAGASTGKIPWTPGYKREILRSRVDGTRLLAEAIRRASAPPSVFLSGSAVGFFGSRPGEVLTDESSKGTGFLSDVVYAWEQAARLTPPTTRLVMFRTGIVVGKGGAFTPLNLLTRYGVGSRLGSGAQYWPWISLHDEAAAIVHLLGSEFSGVVSLVGPTPATAETVTRTLAREMNKPHWFAVPSFAFRMLGDAGKDLILVDENVQSPTLASTGFTFTHTTIEQAIDAFVD
ncbi:TIGR01777 family protein [Salinibacterium sp. UTAS2018]|uniref:TIGR01777 family oxidoreductase n=1 Tax=Salinibacterium sp. UTAS2018 TaxID=2508880 RepID=UPI001009830C|nr:TIGR01777 family oxidoreductase [Salinibacterium sp. UTAS2018]QAV69011.1 TIGR01777 family protein [Salinibacterium sp. UTAS2018]